MSREAQECLDGLLEATFGHLFAAKSSRQEIRKSPTERPERSQRAIAQAAATVGRCCRAGGELRSEARVWRRSLGQPLGLRVVPKSRPRQVSKVSAAAMHVAGGAWTGER